MRRTFVKLFVLAAVALAARPAAGQVPGPLADQIKAWDAAFDAGNGAGVAALYTEDAVRLPPEGPEIKGRAAIAADVGNYAGFTIDLHAQGGLIDGDVGTAWGTFSLIGTDSQGDEMVVGGRWMNVVKKTDDGWKIYRDIWNFGPEGS